MIILYSGTPGSGKSLDVARQIMTKVKFGQKFIGNMLINRDMLGDHAQNYIYVDTYSLNPNELIEYARKYHVPRKESQCILVIDECQQIFNSREWNRPEMKAWNSFFQVHRHFGFDVYLITQYDRLIDRQVRALIEYERMHRKISNLGIKGAIMSFLCGGKLFVCVEQHYSMRLQTGSYFYRYRQKYADFYDSYSAFSEDKMKMNELKPLLGAEKGVSGTPDATGSGLDD